MRTQGIHLKIAGKDEFRTIAEFIARINVYPEQQCLHCGTEVEDVYSEMLDYHSRLELRFVVAYRGEELIGVLGCDCDDVLVRIWFWGPFVKAGESWQEVAEGLYAFFLAETPTAKQFQSFENVENKRGRAFFAAKGYKEGKHQTYEYQMLEAPKSDQMLHPQLKNCCVYEASYYEAVKTLHEVAFPNTYYSMDEMVELDANRNQIIVAVLEGEVAGYVMGNVTANQEGFIHFLAVNPNHRKKGLGSALLLAALQWLFHTKQTTLARLTVSSNNHAQNLYQKVGFSHKYTGIGSSLRMEEN